MNGHFLLQAAGMVAGVIVLHFALSALNCMNADTHHGVRVAFLLLAVGGFGQLAEPLLLAEIPHLADALLSGGLALLLLFDRRCVACPRAAALKTRSRTRDPSREDGELA